ncbi:MAG: type II secretion system protein GspG [Planctomycetota bacterium]
MRTRRYRQGMSLVEILIVLVVVALLATMVISVASRIDTQAKEKGAESMFVLLDSALQEYRQFMDRFPEQAESIPGVQKILAKIDDSSIENKYGTAQTPPEIYDPWGTPLDYRYVVGNNFPRLVSAGPDKTFGTTDDMSNR